MNVGRVRQVMWDERTVYWQLYTL